MESVPPAWYTPNDGLPKTSELSTKKHQWLVKDEVIIQYHIGTTFAENNENQAALPKIVMGTTAQSGQLPREFNYNATFTNNTVQRALQDSLIGTANDVDRVIK